MMTARVKTIALINFVYLNSVPSKALLLNIILTQKEAGDQITACLLTFNRRIAIFGLTTSSAARRGLPFRSDRTGVNRGRPRRISGAARDKENPHLGAIGRNATRSHGDAVGVNLSAEAAVGEAVTHVLGALQIEVGRALVIGAIAVDDESGSRIGLHRGNHTALQDFLAGVVHASVIALEARALAELAVSRRRLWRRRRHSQTDASRSAGRAIALTRGGPDSDFDRRARRDAGRIEHGVQIGAADGPG